MDSSGRYNTVNQIAHSNVYLPAAPSPERIIPWQGPAPAENFFNRRHELNMLNTIVDRDNALIVVNGEDQVGKTDLLAMWALQAKDRFPDGFIYEDFRASVHADGINVSEALGSMLRGLSVPEESIRSDVVTRQKLWFSVTAPARLLLVLDGLDDPTLLKYFRPPSPGTTVVVVSQSHIPFLAAGAKPVSVSPFSEIHSMEFLTKICAPERCESDPDATKDLVALCGGRPRSVSMLGAYLATKEDVTVRQLLQEMTAQVTHPGPQVVEAITRALIVDGLDEGTRHLFEQLVHHPRGGFSTDLVRHLAGSGTDVGSSLDALRHHNLITPVDGHRWKLTGGVRDEPDPNVMRTIVDWYRRAARIADLTYLGPQRLRILDVAPDTTGAMPELTPGNALDWLETELPNLVVVQQYASDAGWDEAVVSFEESLWVLYMHRDHSGYRAKTSALALEAATRQNDPRALSRMAAQRSRHLKEAGEFDAAVRQLEHARALADAADDDSLRASAIEMLGRVHFARGHYEDATAEYLTALKIYQEMDTPEGKRGSALVRRFLGEVHAKTGDLQEAVRFHRLARESFAACGLGRDEGTSALELGLAYIEIEELELAQETLEASNRLLGDFAQRARQAKALKALGAVNRGAGNIDAAQRCWREALEIHAQLHNVDTAAVAELTADLEALTS